MKLGDQITILDGHLKQLIRMWERYFGGDIKQPPVKERTLLQNQLRQLYERRDIINSTERFRLDQLQHRFMSYAQNWERMLREREEGRGRSIAHLRAVARAGQAPPPPKLSNDHPAASVDTGGNDGLFNRYQAAKVQVGQKTGLDRTAFEKQIAGQRAALEAKLGRKVSFDVKVDDGKVKLVVRKNSALKDEE